MKLHRCKFYIFGIGQIYMHHTCFIDSMPSEEYYASFRESWLISLMLKFENHKRRKPLMLSKIKFMDLQ